MLQEKLQKAIENDDWETAAKIENLINSQLDRKIKQKKLEIEAKQAHANIAKTLAETEKINRERQFSFATIITAIVGVVVTLGTFIKSFFK